MWKFGYTKMPIFKLPFLLLMTRMEGQAENIFLAAKLAQIGMYKFQFGRWKSLVCGLGPGVIIKSLFLCQGTIVRTINYTATTVRVEWLKTTRRVSGSFPRDPR